MNANADEVPAAEAAPPAAAVADDAPQPPPLLPWGEKPSPLKRGAPGATSKALAATGADIAPASTKVTNVPVPEFGPKGYINRKHTLRQSRTTVAPRPPQVGGLREEPVGTLNDVKYHYARGYQYADVDGTSANILISKPELAEDDFHTLAEVTVQSGDGKQKVEIGWVVSRNVNGDLDPHLFVYHWIDDKETCWNSCGWTQVSKEVTPGDTLPTGVYKKFGIQQFDNVWWVAYDSVYIGYFDNKLWDGRYTKGGLVQWFGEVASTKDVTCTDMGNGTNWAEDKTVTPSRFNSLSLVGGAKLAYGVESVSPNSDKGLYPTEYETSRTFKFGGPGNGKCR